VLQAETLGYNPHNADWNRFEARTASPALAGLTQAIEIITAIKPYVYHPVVPATMRCRSRTSYRASS
jgi:alkanesulfonate monooxygenase